MKMTKPKIVVVYKSVTGFTREYSEKIAQRTGAALLPLKSATARSLSDFDTVIFGGRMHAGTLDGLKQAKALFAQSSASRLLLFATGACPNEAQDTIAEMWRNNLTPAELAEIPHFYMQGGLRYEKMPLGDRLMMKMFSSVMNRKKDKTDAERQMAAMIGKSFDISSDLYMTPLLKALEGAPLSQP